ncbi:serine-type D-Ala-D-Ala carboxypeptidase (penicillin-binding protein 5/6) [Alphaproteobacteria bacterium]
MTARNAMTHVHHIPLLIALLIYIVSIPYFGYAKQATYTSQHKVTISVSSIKTAKKPVININTDGIKNSDHINHHNFGTKATHAILVDYDTGAILFAKNSTVQMVPSSMTKIMTIYLAFQALKEGWMHLDDLCNVSKKAWSMQGSKMFLNINDSVRVEDLIKGVTVESGNDACIALAEKMSGSEEVFARHMNEMAQKLGLKHSNFLNASGWPEDGHYTTASDLAMLSIALIRDFSEYYHYNAEKEFRYNNITQQNRNTLLGIDGVDGIKTGHTDVAGYGIVTSAKRNHIRLIGVVNGLGTMKEREQEAIKLLNYGFQNFQHDVLYKPNDTVLQANIIYGNKTHVALTVEKTAILILPKSKIQNSDRLVKIRYYDNMTAPIKKGTKMGELIIKQQTLDSTELVMPLVAAETIEVGNFLQHFLQNIEIIFFRKSKNVQGIAP